ncbi:sialidase family protein [Pedococcus sp. 5OH_020]|uniref:sialidase family protein n=1 Tax=Pedococcus sp. 5OH_020 TaxID=2989814 RepID=UPI0022E9D234|nr:sialidase family protein [Pedococcus sp. 5OH_020]
MSPTQDPFDREPRQRDPVADFFARERAMVRDLVPRPEHFESILTEAGRPSGRRWLPYVAVAAAAAIAGAVGLGVLQGKGGGPDHVDVASSTRTSAEVQVSSTTRPGTRTVTGPVSASGPTTSPSRSTSTPPPTGGAPRPLPVPRSFDIASMSNAGGGHLFALGAATCPGGPCTAVVASDDDGRSWASRSSLTGLRTSGARVTPDRPDQLVGLRFASDRIGYVFGSVVRRTSDGGRTWHAVDVGGRVVLSLETDGRQVWMATAGSCTHGGSRRGCHDLQPRTGAVTQDSTRPVAVPSMPTDAENAWVAMDGSDAYYNVTTAGQRHPALAARLSGKPAALSLPEGCAADQGMWVSATASTRGTLLAVCPSAGRPTQGYAVAVSTDRGASWSSRPAPALGRPGGSGVWLTANDPAHLVVLREGLPSSADGADVSTTLVVSDDAGKTWRPGVLGAPGIAGGTSSTPGTGTSSSGNNGSDRTTGSTVTWAGAAGGGLVYALAGGTSYWLSTDAGMTFASVPLRR